jgi:hypothetical protein
VVQLKNHDIVAQRSIREQLPEFSITPEQVSQLRGLFVGGGESMSDLDARRVALASLYLDMLKVFINRHAGEPGLEALQREEALRVTRRVLRLPLPQGWMRVVRCLIITDPRLALVFSGYLWTAVGRRLKRSGLKFYSTFGG